nr:hypothetical protein [uncultured Rhodopila sp.]
MADLDHADYRQTQRKTAHEYRSQGYEVVEAPAAANMPAFLSGLSPDLIAIKAGDHVVVEIRRADRLKGSNEITELAARVANNPDWRFELIALAAPQGPDHSRRLVDPLDRVLGFVTKASETNDAGAQTISLIALAAIVQRLLQRSARQRGIETANRSMKSLIRELSFQGVIDEATLSVLERIGAREEALWNGGTATEAPGQGDVASLQGVCRQIQATLIEYWQHGSVERTQAAYTARAVAALPEGKPIVYAIQTAGGRINYIGMAGAGHVREAIRQHMAPGSARIAGETITVLQFDSEKAANQAHETAVSEFLPPQNMAPGGRSPPSSRRA